MSTTHPNLGVVFEGAVVCGVGLETTERKPHVWSTSRTDAMARETTVRQLSGKEESFQVSMHTSIGEFKRRLHGCLPCEDESRRNMSSVEMVVGHRPLLNKEELVSDAIPGGEVLAFLSIQPVVCSSFQVRSGRLIGGGNSWRGEND